MSTSTNTTSGYLSEVRPMLISGLTVIGTATAAAFASILADDRDIGITAWVAVAVVGASTMIASAKNFGKKKTQDDEEKKK